MKKRRVDETAIEIMKEWGRTCVWYGDPELVLEISDRAGCKKGHPLNRSAAVIRALALSSAFKLDGSIQHLNRRYNVYVIA